MPKQDKDINSSKEIQDKQDNKNHKWSVWTQGPNDAKETTRKFKQTTPGQVRDYKHFVNKRRFQKFEQLESAQHDEEAPVNSVAGGGVDMAPNAKGTKVFMKKYRVDGRTKEYREANRRIKERQEKILQKQVQAKLDMFGVHANPFAEETENKKYLETKPGSIEDAVLNALNPNADKETLTLPKKNEEEVEEGFGKLKDASKNLDKMRRAAGVKVDKQTTTKLPSGGTLRKTTYKKADEEVEIDELSNKTMSSYAQKASASQSDAEKKQDYKTADKRIAGKLRATRRKFSNDTNRILVGLKKESKDLERAMNEDGHTDVASAIRQCKTIMEDTTQMMSKLQSMNPEDALPSWWTNKLAVASNTMNNLRDYFLFPTSESVSKETENGERDAGSDEYTNYTKEMTPGQGITNPDAKKADVRKKKEQAAQQQQLNVDENMKYLNTKPGSIEEAILNALMPEAFTTKHEKGDKHTEVPEKKAGETDKDHKDRQAGRVSFKKHRRSLDAVNPDELQGKHADRKDKDIDNDGDVDSSDQYLHRRRQAIASRRKKEDQKESIAPKQLSSPAPAGKNVKKTAAYKSGVRRSKASGEVYHKADTHHTGTQRHMDDDLPQEKGSGHSTYHKDTRGKKKVRGSKQAHEEVELTPMEQFEQLVTEKHKASKGRLRSPEGKPSDMKWKYKFTPAGRPTPSPRDKADSRERARSGQTIGSIGSNATGTTGTGPRKNQGTSGKSGAYTDRPDWYQSSQKGSEHKTSRGVKTKGVKQTSNKLKPGVKPKGKLPEQTIEKVETEAFANPPAGMKFPTKGVKNMGGPKPRQLKDPKKEKMVGTKTGTKVVNKNDPRYKNAPEHESVESPWIRAAVAYLDKTVDEKTMMGVKVKKLGTQKDSETADVRKAQSGDKDALVRQQARQKFGYKKEDAVDEKTMMGVKVKKLGTQKDSETADVKKAQSGDKDALVRQQKRQKFGYKTS